MVAVRIPGAESIQEVAPARDPGVQASPADFGAGIGASMEHLGSAAVSLSAHLYQKRQAAEDQTYEQTYNVSAAPALQQAEYAARKQFPDGGPGYMQAANESYQRAHQGVIDALAQRGLTPSNEALKRVNTQFAGRQANLLVSAVTYDNNAQVTKLQTQTGENVKSIAAQVLSGNLDVDAAVKQVDGITATAGSLYTGGALSAFKKQARDTVYQAAVDSAIASKDTALASELNARFFGTVPKAKREAVTTAMEYFQSTGKTKEQAAGIVGNLDHESGFDTSATGDNGTAFGIAQWRGERLDALKAYAASKGKPIADLQTQLEFVNKELNSSEGTAHKKLLSAKSTDDAAKAFIGYERPQGYGTTNPHGLSNRVGLARSAAGEAPLADSPNVSVALSNNNKIISMDGVNRADMQSTVKDDLASMEQTGQGNPSLSADKVSTALGPNAAADWQSARTRAKSYYDNTQDFYALPENEINARLETLKPKPGQEEFIAQQQVFAAAQKKADATRVARQEDPASSVSADPQVKLAAKGATLDDPAKLQPLITARLAAQERAGVPEDAQSPLTKAEALTLTVPLRRMLPGQERETLMTMGEQFKKLFGENADSAFAYALRIHKVDAATAQAAARVVKKLGLGEAPDEADTKATDRKGEQAAAEKATGTTSFYEGLHASGDQLNRIIAGTEPMPQQEGANVPLKAIRDLRSNPKLAADFDTKYGKGTSKKILDNYPAVR